MVLKALSLGAALMLVAATPLAARQCKYREMQGVAGEKMTITAKIDSMEPDEDDPKTVWITLDNSAHLCGEHHFPVGSQPSHGGDEDGQIPAGHGCDPHGAGFGLRGRFFVRRRAGAQQTHH